MPLALSLSDVTFGWSGTRGRSGFQLNCPAFEMLAGERVLLLGESGSGKSTLLSLICGINAANGGQVHVAGTALAQLRVGQRDKFRAENIGVIFQQFNLLPYASVLDNILLPLRFAPERRARAGGSSGSREDAARLCAELGLPDDVLTTPAARLSVGQRDKFRAENIGVIFQQFNLLPYASVLDNILLPLRFAPERRARAGGSAGSREDAARLCAELGLPDDVLTTPAARLSVGQQQRVAAARALIGAPPLIVADEPTSALDAATQDSFLKLLFDQSERSGTALLMVSHDARLGERFDRVVRLGDIVTTQRNAA